LNKYGLKMNNAILCEDAHKPIYKELTDNYTVEYIAGGATQNSIRVAQWMLQEHPNATSYIGCVGKDAPAKTMAECARADGVNVCYLEDEKEPTGTCAVLIQNKERSMVANLAAANAYKKAHFDSDEIKAVWSKAKVVYSAGFFLTVSPETVHAMGQHCAENDKIMCVNLAAPFITQFFKDPLMKTINYCDYVFGNESEAASFGEAQGYSDCSVTAVAHKIARLPKANGAKGRIVVITQGALPTIVVKDGVAHEFPVPPVPADEIVDTNGAGDAFVGGFLAGLVKGDSLELCIKAGNYAASVIIKVSGTKLAGKPTF
jgi:adenosine kinase